jgi:hypothetical protein
VFHVGRCEDVRRLAGKDPVPEQPGGAEGQVNPDEMLLLEGARHVDQRRSQAAGGIDLQDRPGLSLHYLAAAFGKKSGSPFSL